MGADYEFLGRAEWANVQRTYGVHFAQTSTFDPSLLYEALARDEIDVISAFSSDGRIAAYDLVVLGDPAGALPPYDAMILLGPRVADDGRLACALGALHIDVELMRRANALVDRDGKTSHDAAMWLLGQLGTLPACSDG
jgi:osmoprotectant transport system permease protein